MCIRDSNSIAIGPTNPTHTLTVAGTISSTEGLSGSLTALSDGSPYLLAGPNITLATGSTGAITISASGGGGGGGGGFFGGGGGADDDNSWGGQGGGAGSSFIRGKITNYSTSAFNSVSATGVTYSSGTFRTAAYSSANGGWGMRTTYDFTSAGFGSGWGQSNSITPGHGGRENSSYPGYGTDGGDGLVFWRLGSSGSYTKLTNVATLTALTIS